MILCALAYGIPGRLGNVGKAASMSQSSTLLTINRWLIVLFTVLMVVTAALAGNGIYKKGSMEWLITGHQHIGNLLFGLAVLQLVICYVMWTRKTIGGGIMLTSALVFLFTFAQIGLGYSTRSHMVELVGWHIAVGVGLTATTAVLATLLWTSRPREGSISTT
jgi:cytochrome b561